MATMTDDATRKMLTLAARLGDLRRSADYPDLDMFVAAATHASPADAVRMANRLRATVYREARIDAIETDRVPPSALTELWETPVLVWTWASRVTHISAMAVAPRLYLETNPRGYYETPTDHFGAQVIVRSHSAGEPDAYAVFWRPDGTDTWRRVTPEMDADRMAAWDGLPVKYDDRRGAMRETAEWLDSVVTCIGES